MLNNKLFLFRFFLYFLILLGFCSLNSCVYWNVVRYQKPGIYDYKIFKNATVLSGNSKPFALHEQYNKKSISQQHLDYFRGKNTRAYIVIKDGKLFHEQYWGKSTVNSYSNSFSVAKSIISLLIGIAIDEGYIKNIDTPVSKYLGTYSNKADTAITIRHLLEMSAGFQWSEKYTKPLGKIAKAYYGKDLVKLVSKLKSARKPGEFYEYQSICTQLLAFVLEKATGRDAALYASEKLWQPLGCESQALWSKDNKHGNVKAYCCFNAIARDFAKIGQLVLNKGIWEGKQIISSHYLNAAMAPAVHLKDEYNKNVNYYGFHWWLANYKEMQIPYARGILGQYILVIPEKNMVVVRLGETHKRKYIDMHPQEIFYYIDGAIALTE